jgi:alpha-glucosidase/alpha-D-xyloside xylohydrolase
VQFAAVCGSLRAHGRVWWLRLPWGWGGSELGPLEYGNNNQTPAPGDPRNIDKDELNNPAIEPIARKYVELRYRLLPYTYTLSREARDRGLPLMRSLWVHYPTDARARAIGDQYLWGRDLMIAPVYTKGATTKSVYLPSGDWYDWWTNARTTGGRTVQRDVDLATMPIYARAGAIVPVDPVRQHTGETIAGPTTLRVFPGRNGDFTLYDDDGISQQYLNGRGNWIRMAWNDATNTLALEPGAPSGSTDVVRNRDFRVVLPDGRSKDVSYGGRRVTVVF